MTVTLLEGDCLDVMPTLEANSIDSIVCDPPYGLSFMGKDWDYGAPGVAFWEAALRVAKPGAMLLAFGGTRTHHRLMVAIEDAGWEIRDCLMWLYGSGFPKSHDISKAIDKAAGAEREVIGAKMRPDGRAMIDARLNGFNGSHEGWDRPWKHDRDSIERQASITAPATDAAQEWRGYGTALKPAWEPIILAMKPLDGTFAHNALAHGVAGLNVDKARIGTNERPHIERRNDKSLDGDVYGSGINGSRSLGTTNLGRWPSNVLLDEDAADGQEWSRFFYVAKSSKRERNAGLEGMVNSHPTLKPIELMRYLCRLTKTPTGGIVLDPFMGSGSTGCAAVLEGRSFVGSDTNPEYVAIAEKRIAAAQKQIALPLLEAAG